MNTREFGMYQGAMPQAPQRMEVQVPHIEAVPLRGEQVDAALRRGERVVEELAELHDLGVQQRQELALKDLEARRNEDFLARSEAWGSEDGFYNEDGTRNSNAVEAFKKKWREENDKIARPFWLSRNRAAGQARHDEVAQKIGLGLDVDLAAQERKNIAAVWQDNYQLELARGNHGVCMGMIDEAVGKGLLRPSEGRLMKYRLGRSRACGGGCGGNGQADVRIGNQHFTDGASATMAAQMANEGVEVAEEVEPEQLLEPSKGPGATTLGDVLRAGEAGGAAGNAVGDADELTMGRGGLEEGGGLPNEGNELTTSAPGNGASGVERFQELGDFGPVFRSMPASEFGTFADTMMWEPLSQRPVEGEDGRRVYEVDSQAPESVQRVQAQANATGELGKEAVTGAVVDMTLSQVLDDPTATPEQLLKPYEGSGWFEALGDGDAEVGKVRMHALVADCVERGRNGTAGVNNKTVEMLVGSRLAEPDVGAGEEWFEMERLNPYKGKDKSWKKPSDEAEHARWMSLFNVYRKYRSQYNPGATGEVDKGEFAIHAQSFWDWYMRSGGPHERMRKAYMGAARDWYQAEVRGALLDAAVNDRGSIKYAQDGAGGVSYVGEVSVIKGVLGKSLPQDMGVAALLGEQERREAEEGRRGEAYARKAQKSYQLLKGAKEQAAQKTQAAKEEEKEKARAEKEAERKREKAEAAEEKRQEKEAELRLRKARGQLRGEKWSWNRVDCGFKETKCAWVPAAEWERMQRELGHDGSQIPYIVVGNQEFLVVGPHDGRRCSYGGKVYNVVSPQQKAVQGLLLNTPAVQSLQKKPNFKKGEKWMLNGEFSYSYKFKDYKN